MRKIKLTKEERMIEDSHNLASIKHKAQRLGIRYQTFISEVIHKIAQAH